MIVWQIRTLSDRLRQGPLTARQALPYLIAAIASVTLTFVFADWSRPWDRDEFETGVDSLTTLVNGLISVVGLYACYRANGGVDGLQLAVSLHVLRPSLEELDVLSLLVVALFWIRLRSHVASIAKRSI